MARNNLVIVPGPDPEQKKLDEKTIEEIINRPVKQVTKLTPPHFETQLVSFKDDRSLSKILKSLFKR